MNFVSTLADKSPRHAALVLRNRNRIKMSKTNAAKKIIQK